MRHHCRARTLKSKEPEKRAGLAKVCLLLCSQLGRVDWRPRGPWLRSFWSRGTESWSQLSRSFERRLEWKTVLDEDKKVTTPKSLLKKRWKIVSQRNQSQKERVEGKKCWWAGTPECAWAQLSSSCSAECWALCLSERDGGLRGVSGCGMSKMADCRPWF